MRGAWRTRPASRWLIPLLLAVIAANEAQRTLAQAAGHRERAELAISIAELDRKVDWLIRRSTPPSTSSAPPRPPRHP